MLDNKPYQDTKALNETACEIDRARKMHSSFASAHEGLAVIHEEFVELQMEVYKKRQNRDIDKMRLEAIQIAAMAIRFASDITPRS